VNDRIDLIRRGDLPRSVEVVAPVAGRDRRREQEQRERPRRRPPAPPAVTRDDDGTPHVDIRA
jgi:hypothetical protein